MNTYARASDVLEMPVTALHCCLTGRWIIAPFRFSVHSTCPLFRHCAPAESLSDSWGLVSISLLLLARLARNFPNRALA